MKHELRYTIYFTLAVLLTGLIALLAGPYAIVQSSGLADENPFVVLSVVIASMSLGTFAFVKFQKRITAVWFDVIMIFAFTQAITMFVRLFVEASGWVFALIWFSVYVVLYWGLLRPMQVRLENMFVLAHVWNFFMAFAFLGLGIQLGYLLPVWASIFLLTVASVYDWYAVHKSKHMVGLAQFFLKRRLFPGFIMLKSDLKFAMLGGGDVFFIVLLSVGLLKVSPVLAWFGFGGMMLGLVWLYLVSSKSKFYPALPPIAAGLFAGVGVGLVLQMFNVVKTVCEVLI